MDVMMRLPAFVLCGATCLAATLLIAGCESDLQPLSLPSDLTVEQTFVGAAKCGVCHQGEYAEFLESGHAHILQRVVGGQLPSYPFRNEVPFPLLAAPDGSWDDVLYVVGGFGWKALFVGTDGNLVTGDATQWNLETGEWVTYHPGEQKPYDCGACHTTGYSPTGHMLGLTGLAGTWAEDGVTCEACHGAGALHVLSQSGEDINLDRSNALCGRCHSRGVPNRIVAYAPDSEGDQFLANYGQYDEMKAGAHRNLTCVSCHDPHPSAKFRPEQGIVLSCETCHEEIEIYNTGGGAHTCEVCHMPSASLSAVKRSHHQADVQTHIFRINPASAAEMFYQENGSWFSHNFLTTDFTCLRCHAGQDRQWAEEHADEIHSGGKRPFVAGR
jgi:hypothetical protein